MSGPLDETHLPERGRVNRVRQEWLVHEDEAMAGGLQQEEFHNKYQWNRGERHVARKDVPLAKHLQVSEEEEQQRKRFQLLEKQQQIAERDRELAEIVQSQEQKNVRKVESSVTDDSILAQQFQQEELVGIERERVRREIKDQEYAKVLQEKEMRKYEHKMKERDLARERKRIEVEQQMQANELLSGVQRMGLREDPSTKRVVRTNGRVEDTGDFSDFYIPPSGNMDPNEQKELQELQDEELARLLQDQERKRGAKIDQTALKTLEARDEELAKIMQEQEKLRLKRKQQRHKARHQSEEVYHDRQLQPRHNRNISDPGHSPTPPVPEKSSPVLRYEMENRHNEYMNVSSQSSGLPVSYPRTSPSGPSPYAHRPLPRTPENGSLPSDSITVVPVAIYGGSPPASPPPPGYKPPPAYPSRPQGPPESNSSSRTSPPSSNVIASIDPTCGRLDPPPEYQSQHQAGSPPPRSGFHW